MNTLELLNFTGKRVLVTGASSGIGRACAIMLADLGASVVLTGRRADALDETWRRMENKDAHLIYPCDITDANAVADLVKNAGKLDGLVHAAGIAPMCPVGFVERDLDESVFKTNYYSFLELMKHYSKGKNRKERFSAVAISSVAAFSGCGGVSVYAGSKGALSASVRAIAMELASKGVRVNTVCPSNVKTPMYDAGSKEMNTDESLKALLSKQPLGLGVPEQVASAVAFLLSDVASFITGVNLPVDGGYLAQ